MFLQSVSGVVKSDQPDCQVPAVLISLLDGLDKLLSGDPLVLVLVHLPEHLLTMIALSVLLEQESQVTDDFLHFTFADGAVAVDIKHLEHPAKRLIYVPKGQDVVNQHELLHQKTRF